MADNSKIEQALAPVFKQNGIELVDIVVSRTGRKPTLQFFIDKLEGAINVEDCARMSGKIEGVLDMEEFFPQGYIIEVSSPGINRPLKKPAHYLRFAGERAKVVLREMVENRAVFTGVIESADDAQFTLFDGTSRFTFKYDRVKKAVLDPVVEF
ncbi:MAG: ribosome maturation factor RimP [Elusimicrobiaceae bacterium]|nr:ribosome maturation factor RimP [Elusimicrobiaceae bacterium]